MLDWAEKKSEKRNKIKIFVKKNINHTTGYYVLEWKRRKNFVENSDKPVFCKTRPFSNTIIKCSGSR